jgi:serine/threonine-protein kinase
MSAGMSPAEWARIEARFHQVHEAPAAEQPALLAALEAEDPALAAEVRSLLAALDAGPVPELASTTNAGELVAEFVGPYRLLRRLGEGGMGTVFLAEREVGGFRQRVALKLLRAGFLDPRMAEQAAHERRVLARLEHPNIARLIDGGSTPSGQPFLAMEYVEGCTLLDHAIEERLSVPARVRLFIEVCEAVHYAHQQLVIHRDLKPTNVVVGSDGRPRLLDFGISKLVDRDELPSGATRTMLWITPGYASPEQLRGQPVSTLSDIYSLGVILYQLLSGVRPYLVDGKSPAELERLVCEVIPPAPSQQAPDPAVARELRGDLDVIVLKALAKDPNRRYASAEQLAEDLRLFLTGRPVLARPDSLGYRTRKFVRRHRGGVAAALITGTLVITGVILVGAQARIAREERDRAEAARAQSDEVTSYLIGLFEASDPTQASVDTAVGQALLRQGLRQAEALSEQPELQARMFDALGMIFVNLGQYDRAAELITRGLNLRTATLPPDHPDRAVSLSHLGRARRGQSRYPEAETTYLEALEIRRRTLGPKDPAVAESYRDLGFLMPYLARNEESLRYYEEALALDREVLGEEHSQTAADLALAGLALARLGRHPESLALLEESLARNVRVLGRDHPETARIKFHVADRLAAADRIEEAGQLYREGIAARRAALGADDLGMAHGLSNLAWMLGHNGEGAEAEALLRQVLDINRRRLGERSAGYAQALDGLASEMERQKRLTEALAFRRQSLATWQATVGTEHTAVAGSMRALAELLTVVGRLPEAEQMARQALAIWTRVLGPAHSLVGLGQTAIGTVLLKQRRLAEAEEVGLKAIAILEASLPADHGDLRQAHALLADVYAAMGRP